MIKFKSFMNKILNLLKIFYRDAIKYPLYLMSHPIEGFYEFKRYNKGKIWVSIFYLVMYCVLSLVSYNGNGFLINHNDPNKFNAFQIILLQIAPVLLVVVGNWSITVLMSGKGTMKDIFTLSGYCFFPVVWLGFPNILISNVMTADEQTFYIVINIIAYVLLFYNIFFGLMGIHEYGFMQNVGTILCTLVAVCVIIFIGLLFLSLIQDVYGFVDQIYREIRIRYF